MLPLSAEGRIERVRDVLLDRGVDALVVTDLSDIRWLTGFRGSVGTLIIERTDSTLLVDGRYTEQALSQVAGSKASTGVREARTSAIVAEFVAESLLGCVQIGVTLDRLGARTYEQLRSHHGDAVVDVGHLIDEFRSVKDEAELQRIEHACRAADSALEAVKPMLDDVTHSAVTERDVRDELEYRMRRFGADGPSYETIVASGPNSALPHHRPTDRRIVEGDSVVIDVGALVEGYHSDMTRTFLIGEVGGELERMYAAVKEAQQLGLATVRAGIAGSEVDAACRASFGDDAPWFVHGTGHGVGLDIHESPWLRSGASRALRKSEVVTVEPGLYRVGVGGVRIEDLVVVEPTGCRILTLSPKEPLCPQSAPMT
jgi:Xaa-Pro aminopeptidase